MEHPSLAKDVFWGICGHTQTSSTILNFMDIKHSYPFITDWLWNNYIPTDKKKIFQGYIFVNQFAVVIVFFPQTNIIALFLVFYTST